MLCDICRNRFTFSLLFSRAQTSWSVWGAIKDKNSSFKRFIVESGLIFIIWGTLILDFFAYFKSFFKLKAVAAMSIHLLACLSPLVFTFCMPRKLIKVPNTGSTVLIRLDLCHLFCASRALFRSYSSRYAVMEIFLLYWLLLKQLFFNGQFKNTIIRKESQRKRKLKRPKQVPLRFLNNSKFRISVILLDQ